MRCSGCWGRGRAASALSGAYGAFKNGQIMPTNRESQLNFTATFLGLIIVLSANKI